MHHVQRHKGLPGLRWHWPWVIRWKLTEDDRMVSALKILPGTGRGTARRAVEGLALLGQMHRIPDHRFKMRKDVARGYSPGAIAPCHQPFVARFVIGGIGASVVGLPVDFDHQPR